ncbi:hypothetical protein CEXT_490101 [Caerostris extrusa]|uniref:Uncharacterized protein n=1 Tax=Caerostris extrusa TaxID=172846 RepID=A0AAV4WY08_CAEEX|nr:hypothetical protein CEXT_490101 [Caerostris extrusa]
MRDVSPTGLVAELLRVNEALGITIPQIFFLYCNFFRDNCSAVGVELEKIPTRQLGCQCEIFALQQSPSSLIPRLFFSPHLNPISGAK